MSEELKTITIDLVTRPDVPNLNGYTYTKDALKNAVDTYNERIKTGTSYITMGYIQGDLARQMSIFPNDIYGILRSIDIENHTAEISIWPNREEASAIEAMIEDNKFMLGMHYLVEDGLLTDKIVHKMNISYSALLPTNTVALEHASFIGIMNSKILNGFKIHNVNTSETGRKTAEVKVKGRDSIITVYLSDGVLALDEVSFLKDEEYRETFIQRFNHELGYWELRFKEQK